jgi:hypothetical protein
MQISIINPVTNRLKIYEYFYFQIKSIHSFISPNIYEYAVSIVNIRKQVMSHSKKTRTFSNYFNTGTHYPDSGKHVAPRGHIILIPSHPVFALTPQCCGEATNT